MKKFDFLKNIIIILFFDVIQKNIFEKKLYFYSLLSLLFFEVS